MLDLSRIFEPEPRRRAVAQRRPPVRLARRCLGRDAAAPASMKASNIEIAESTELYNTDEIRLLSVVDVKPGGLPLVDLIKTTFAELGVATLVDIRPDPDATPRRRAARLIRHARRTADRDRAVALRDAFNERLAICMVDGELNQEEAEKIAIEEIDALERATASQ